MANWTRVDDADSEPFSAAQLKTWLKIDHSDEDALLTDLIKLARIDAEEITGRALITQTWELHLDAFPCSRELFYSTVEYQSNRAGIIKLPRPPVQSIEHVKYVAPSAVSSTTYTTLAATEYQLDKKSEPSRLEPEYNKYWPDTKAVPNAVQIRYVCGYGNDATNIPVSIMHAIRLLVGTYYRDREGFTKAEQKPIPRGIYALLNQHRIVPI